MADTLSDLEIRKACAKALGFQETAGDYGGPLILYFDPATPPSSGFFEYDPLTNSDQHEELVSWLLKEGYTVTFTAGSCNITRRYYEHTVASIGQGDFTITANRYRVVAEFVAGLRKERT